MPQNLHLQHLRHRLKNHSAQSTSGPCPFLRVSVTPTMASFRVAMRLHVKMLGISLQSFTKALLEPVTPHSIAFKAFGKHSDTQALTRRSQGTASLASL